MFDGRLQQLDARGTAATFECCVRDQIVAECSKVELAAHWADLHPPEGLPRAGSSPSAMVGERSVQLGGAGTPRVAEFAAIELAVEAGLRPPEASSLLADALDLRHRLPLLWNRVCTAEVQAWKARRVARRTRELTPAQCAEVDRRIAPRAERLSGYGLDQRITAELMRVDTERMEQLAAEARRSRRIRIGQSTEDGVAAVFALVDAATAIRLKAQLERLADILQNSREPIPGVRDLDARTRDEWLVAAFEVLGTTPGLAFKILVEHQHPDLFTAYADLFAPHPDTLTVSGDPSASIDDPADQADHGNEHDQSSEPPAHESTSDQDPPPDDLDQLDLGTVTEQTASPASPGIVGPRPQADSTPPEALTALVRAIGPETFQPKAVLYVHLAEDAIDGSPRAVARVEEIGPALLSQVRQWLGASRVRLQPVIDPHGIAPVSRYEIPDRMREALLVRDPRSSFPYSTHDSRRQDVDHTMAYRAGSSGPPQTMIAGTSLLARSEHRFKTFGRISVRQPEPGTCVWRTRYGKTIIRTPAGSFPLDGGSFADLVWDAAAGRTSGSRTSSSRTPGSRTSGSRTSRPLTSGSRTSGPVEGSGSVAAVRPHDAALSW